MAHRRRAAAAQLPLAVRVRRLEETLRLERRRRRRAQRALEERTWRIEAIVRNFVCSLLPFLDALVARFEKRRPSRSDQQVIDSQDSEDSSKRKTAVESGTADSQSANEKNPNTLLSSLPSTSKIETNNRSNGSERTERDLKTGVALIKTSDSKNTAKKEISPERKASSTSESPFRQPEVSKKPFQKTSTWRAPSWPAPIFSTATSFMTRPPPPSLRSRPVISTFDSNILRQYPGFPAPPPPLPMVQWTRGFPHHQPPLALHPTPAWALQHPPPTPTPPPPSSVEFISVRSSPSPFSGTVASHVFQPLQQQQQRAVMFECPAFPKPSSALPLDQVHQQTPRLSYAEVATRPPKELTKKTDILNTPIQAMETLRSCSGSLSQGSRRLKSSVEPPSQPPPSAATRIYEEYERLIQAHSNSDNMELHLSQQSTHSTNVEGTEASVASDVTLQAAGGLELSHLPVSPPDASLGDSRMVVMAANNGDLEKLRKMLEEGADPNARSQKGDSALLCAVNQCHPEIMRLLLQHGADPSLPNDRGITPLHRAACGWKKDLLEELVRAGAHLEARDHEGNTSLACAVLQNREDNVAALLRAGADIAACWNVRRRANFAIKQMLDNSLI